jgi:hypothetical protein
MKIVIFNEPNYRAGGVESIYQLCHSINEQGGECYLKFVKDVDDPIPDEYKKYNIKITSTLDDVPSTLVIIPEVWTHFTNTIQNAKRAIWWLSVDNNHGAFTDFANDSILHFYQSTYAKEFLENKGAKNIIPAHDYIYDAINFTSLPKEDIVCYNPAKGQQATNYIISKCTNVRFIPLVNMSREELLNTLQKSKIYIDFGHHPGRDRIPREAALCGNIVITSMIGSAANDVDVPIPAKFKLTQLDETIANTITDTLQNYDNIIHEYTPYTEAIKNQQADTYADALNIINLQYDT